MTASSATTFGDVTSVPENNAGYMMELVTSYISLSGKACITGFRYNGFYWLIKAFFWLIMAEKHG